MMIHDGHLSVGLGKEGVELVSYNKMGREEILY
jgi:hypothetical protein